MSLQNIENCDGWDCPNAYVCNENDGQDTCPLNHPDCNFTDRTTPLDKLFDRS